MLQPVRGYRNGGPNRSVPSLVRWGVSPDGDLTYRTLRLYGRQSVAGIARELGMPQARVNAAVAELDAVGAIVRTNGGDWAGVPPHDAVVLLEQLRRPRPVIPQQTRSRAVATVSNLIAEIGSGLRLLQSRQATRERLSRLISVAKFEHLVINPEIQFESSSVEAASTTDQMLISRGVSVRELAVVGQGGPVHPPEIPNGKLRVAANVPMKLFVIDRRVALFPVDPLDYDRGYLEIEQAPVVMSLVGMFEQYWSTADDPEAARSDRGDGALVLSPREHVLLGLLAEGLTDAGAARHMRISERSVSSMIRSLMDRTGVENRFQLGLAVGALRLVPDLPGVARSAPPVGSRPA
jgi:DNA-binding CsgD family transcriptional regulator